MKRIPTQLRSNLLKQEIAWKHDSLQSKALWKIIMPALESNIEALDLLQRGSDRRRGYSKILYADLVHQYSKLRLSFGHKAEVSWGRPLSVWVLDLNLTVTFKFFYWIK